MLGRSDHYIESNMGWLQPILELLQMLKYVKDSWVHFHWVRLATSLKSQSEHKLGAWESAANIMAMSKPYRSGTHPIPYFVQTLYFLVSHIER